MPSGSSLARAICRHIGARMTATTLVGKSVFVRELLPQDLKLEIETLTRDEAMSVAHFLAQVVGRGHARQLSADDRRAWLAELHRNRSKSLEAPSWLWNSVVDLVAAHEAAICSIADASHYRLPDRLTLAF